VCNRYLVLFTLASLALSVILNIVNPYGYVNAQVNQSGQNKIFTSNNSMATGTTSNTTGIMKNTSGMLDDAFDALRDAFGSLFGK
jgi:hypothetical protein